MEVNDFSENFTYVKAWIDQADFAIADFEGTISPDFDLAGYPVFDALSITMPPIFMTAGLRLSGLGSQS